MTDALESEDEVWVAGDHRCSEKGNAVMKYGLMNINRPTRFVLVRCCALN